jgi:hypothetical protein
MLRTASTFTTTTTPRESKPVIFNSGAVIPTWLSRHSHGDSKVTGGDVATAALQKSAIAAIVNSFRRAICLFLSKRRLCETPSVEF